MNDRESARLLGRHKPLSYDISVATAFFGGACLVAYLIYLVTASSEDTLMIFILAVLLIVWRTARFELGLAASIAATGIYYYFFVQPRSEIGDAAPNYVVTLFTLTFVSLITSLLTSAIQEEAQKARDNNLLSGTLLELYDRIADEKDADELIETGLTMVSEKLDCDAGYLRIDEDGNPEKTWILRKAGVSDPPAVMPTYKADVLMQKLSNSDANYVVTDFYYDWPLRGHSELLGVIRVRKEDEDYFTGIQTRLLHAMVDGIALGIDRFRSAEQRARANEEASREHLRGVLLRSISHDIRTPLTSIIGDAEMIMGMGPGWGTIHDLATDIHEDARSLSGMVRNVLEITRLESGIQIEKQVEVIEEIIGVAVSGIERFYPDYDIQVDLPDEVLMAPMEARLIQQVLTNLLENAIRHTDPGKEIRVILREKSGNAVITVRDSGGGIDPGDLDKIFEPFYTSGRSDSVQRNGKQHYGLGLSICVAIVRAHGGTIYARNRRDGTGAELSFTLPLQSALENTDDVDRGESGDVRQQM